MEMNNYVYYVQGRNGYWAIDLYKDGKCLRNIDIFKTKKQALAVADVLHEALRLGRTIPSHIG